MKFVFVVMKEEYRASTADDDHYYPEEGGDDFHDGINLYLCVLGGSRLI